MKEQARKYAVAAQWARILTDEFSNQGAMEKELNLPTCLFGGPPDPTDAIKMAESQLGFMNIFARPLFEGVTDILPPMSFTLNELSTNKAIWQERIEAEHSRKRSLMHGGNTDRATSSAHTKSVATTNEHERSRETETSAAEPIERDSLFGPARNSMQLAADQYKSASNGHSRSGDGPPSPRTTDDGRSSMTRTSITGMKRSSGNASMLPPVSSSFNFSGSPSRRSSKDVALDQLDSLNRNSYPREQHQNITASRRGSADASLTTILVRNQPDLSNGPGSHPASPVKSSFSQSTQPELEKPSSSAGSHSTSNATAIQQCPSTEASSLEDTQIPQPPPIPSTENPFLHPHSGTPDIQTPLHRSAPDVLAMTGTSPAKSSIRSQVMTSDSDDYNRSFGDQKHDMRQSRSQSRLRGLKFWKKKARGIDAEYDQPSP